MAGKVKKSKLTVAIKTTIKEIQSKKEAITTYVLQQLETQGDDYEAKLLEFDILCEFKLVGCSINVHLNDKKVDIVIF